MNFLTTQSMHKCIKYDVLAHVESFYLSLPPCSLSHGLYTAKSCIVLMDFKTAHTHTNIQTHPSFNMSNVYKLHLFGHVYPYLYIFCTRDVLAYYLECVSTFAITREQQQNDEWILVVWSIRIREKKIPFTHCISPWVHQSHKCGGSENPVHI